MAAPPNPTAHHKPVTGDMNTRGAAPPQNLPPAPLPPHPESFLPYLVTRVHRTARDLPCASHPRFLQELGAGTTKNAWLQPRPPPWDRDTPPSTPPVPRGGTGGPTAPKRTSPSCSALLFAEQLPHRCSASAISNTSQVLGISLDERSQLPSVSFVSSLTSTQTLCSFPLIVY